MQEETHRYGPARSVQSLQTASPIERETALLEVRVQKLSVLLPCLHADRAIARTLTPTAALGFFLLSAEYDRPEDVDEPVMSVCRWRA